MSLTPPSSPCSNYSSSSSSSCSDDSDFDYVLSSPESPTASETELESPDSRYHTGASFFSRANEVGTVGADSKALLRAAELYREAAMAMRSPVALGWYQRAMTLMSVANDDMTRYSHLYQDVLESFLRYVGCSNPRIDTRSFQNWMRRQLPTHTAMVASERQEYRWALIEIGHIIAEGSGPIVCDYDLARSFYTEAMRLGDIDGGIWKLQSYVEQNRLGDARAYLTELSGAISARGELTAEQKKRYEENRAKALEESAGARKRKSSSSSSSSAGRSQPSPLPADEDREKRQRRSTSSRSSTNTTRLPLPPPRLSSTTTSSSSSSIRRTTTRTTRTRPETVPSPLRLSSSSTGETARRTIATTTTTTRQAPPPILRLSSSSSTSSTTTTSSTMPSFQEVLKNTFLAGRRTIRAHLTGQAVAAADMKAALAWLKSYIEVQEACGGSATTIAQACVSLAQYYERQPAAREALRYYEKAQETREVEVNGQIARLLLHLGRHSVRPEERQARFLKAHRILFLLLQFSQNQGIQHRDFSKQVRDRRAPEGLGPEARQRMAASYHLLATIYDNGWGQPKNAYYANRLHEIAMQLGEPQSTAIVRERSMPLQRELELYQRLNHTYTTYAEDYYYDNPAKEPLNQLAIRTNSLGFNGLRTKVEMELATAFAYQGIRSYRYARTTKRRPSSSYFTAAKKCAEEALKLDPRHARAAHLLANIYQKRLAGCGSEPAAEQQRKISHYAAISIRGGAGDPRVVTPTTTTPVAANDDDAIPAVVGTPYQPDFGL